MTSVLQIELELNFLSFLLRSFPLCWWRRFVDNIVNQFFLLLLLLITTHAWAGGSLSGRVKFQGGFSAPRITPIMVDTQVCGSQSVSRELVIAKNGGVKNAVISLKGPVIGARPFSSPEGRFVMDQRVCRFEPHVQIVGAGMSLEVLNSDGILHNFHTASRVNPVVSKVQTPLMGKMTLSFGRPEIFQVRCDIHPWMSAWIVVAEHPYYALSDEEGHFRLNDIPAGDYTLNLWHEVLGLQSKRVQVTEGNETKVVFKVREP